MDEDLLADLLLLWEEQLERGGELPPEELCRDRPELVEPLRQRIAALKQMAGVTPPSTVGDPPASSLLPAGRPSRDDDSPERLAQAAAAMDFLAPPQRPDEIGRLGPYRILKVLGQGGMGVVFQAEDPRLGRLCAIKTMLPHVAHQPAMKERFLREARTAAQLEHDNIIPIYQVDEDRGVPYIAMPFLKGTSLEDWLNQKQQDQPGPPLTEPEILKLGREIARGLAAAHDQGLVHRDIKPANIWLDATADGRVKILDFGLARLSENAGQRHLTESGTVLGTPAYMAPEQARGEKVDRRADLFSLGVVLYRLCTGELPFKGSNPISVFRALTRREPPAVRDLNAAISPALSDLIVALLAKDPANRVSSAGEVVQKIQAIEGSLTGSAVRWPEMPPTPPPRVAPPIEHPSELQAFGRGEIEQPLPPGRGSDGRASRTWTRIGLVAVLLGGVLLAGGIVLWSWGVFRAAAVPPAPVPSSTR